MKMMMPDFIYLLDWPLIRTVANDFGIDHFIVAAIIMVESSGNPCVTRYEKNYRYLPDSETIRIIAQGNRETIVTTRKNLKTSWGLMQVMGATAFDECDFRGHFSKLCEPKIGLKMGCCYLKKQLVRYNGNINDAIASYNFGHVQMTPGGMYVNERYYTDVMNFYREFRDFSEN